MTAAVLPMQQPESLAITALQRAGASVARLALLEGFTEEEAVHLSDGQFAEPQRQRAIDFLFEMDRPAKQLRVRSSYDGEILEQLLQLYPEASKELAARLMPLVIGEEVEDPEYLVSWMTRCRTWPVARAAVAALVAYSPFEGRAVASAGIQRMHKQPGIFTGLNPYADTARRWLLALRFSETADAGVAGLNLLSNMTRHWVSADPKASDQPDAAGIWEASFQPVAIFRSRRPVRGAPARVRVGGEPRRSG